MRPRSSGSLRVLVVFLIAAVGGTAVADEFEDVKKKVRKSIRHEDPATRSRAFLPLLDHDSKEAVEEVVDILAPDADPVVLVAGVSALGKMRSAGATEALIAAVRSAKGWKRLLLLTVFREATSEAGGDLLQELLAGNDPAAVAHAAIALGRRKTTAALPKILDLLADKDWQVRAAAARALAGFGSAVPAAERARIVRALEASEGRERTDLVAALEAVTGRGKDLGDDPKAWSALVTGGEAPRAPRPTTYVVGIPVRGKRVVIVVDHSVCTDDPHPYARERLQGLCRVPGARDVPWFEIKTVGQFLAGHANRLVHDLDDDRSIGFISVGGKKIGSKLARPSPATPGAKAAIAKGLEGLKPENGLDVVGALTAALDAGGKDPAAWSAGPDEIVYLGCGMPWLAEIKLPAVAAATIGLRARLRMVPIHTIGVGPHGQEMMRTIAELSGGRYLDLRQ